MLEAWRRAFSGRFANETNREGRNCHVGNGSPCSWELPLLGLATAVLLRIRLRGQSGYFVIAEIVSKKEKDELRVRWFPFAGVRQKGPGFGLHADGSHWRTGRF
jgi:hypothetical protein